MSIISQIHHKVKELKFKIYISQEKEVLIPLIKCIIRYLQTLTVGILKRMKY